jgi:hypothetical protein
MIELDFSFNCMIKSSSNISSKFTKYGFGYDSMIDEVWFSFLLFVEEEKNILSDFEIFVSNLKLLYLDCENEIIKVDLSLNVGYLNQCNFSISNSTIKYLTSIGINLNISCYKTYLS